MSVDQPDLHLAGDVLQALLDAIPGTTVFDNSVTSEAGDETDPTVDAQGRVTKYVVIYDGPGTGWSPSIAQQPSAATYSAQLTCVGPDANSCRWVIREARKAVVGQPAGTGQGVFVEPPGERPPIRPDRSARPARWVGVLLIQATVSA